MAARAAGQKTSSRGTDRAAGKKSSASARRGGKAAGAGLKVRMYRVGFGDFFLLTVPTPAGNRFVVIDCGVFKGKTGKGDIGSIEDAVEDLHKTTGGELALVIMTHRHADHIAGFSRVAKFREFTVGMVWMPYWEQFNDAKAADASGLQADINELAMRLGMQFGGRTDPAAQLALDQLWNATGIDFSAAAKGDRRKGGNAVALDLLKTQFGNNGKNVRYYAAGDEAELPAALKGSLQAQILGPPPKEAQVFLELTDLKKGVGQYLDAVAGADADNQSIRPFRPEWSAGAREAYPATDPGNFPVDYDKITGMVDSAQPDLLAAAAAKIDTFLNNQSLVVLFTVGAKKLLFVGDAQAGNWEYWLYKLNAPVKDPTKAGDLAEESRKLLQAVDFYKVGHHGSTNATPISVVEALGDHHAAPGFVAMCSTESGTYGNVAKGTEVPRDPLLKALGDECALVRSDQFPITTSSGIVPPAEDAKADLPTPKTGKLVKGNLYVEYSFDD